MKPTKHALTVLVILLALLISAVSECEENPSAPSDYYVDALGGDDANPGTMDEPWQSLTRVGSQTLVPGDVVHFKRGSVWQGESLRIGAQGEEGAPILFQPYGTGDAPRIEQGTIVFSGAAHVVVTGFEVTGARGAAVSLQQGTHHVEVSGNHLHHNFLGVWMGDGVGDNNRVVGNEIDTNSGHGVAVDEVFCSPGNETVIADNDIHGNVWHGIELSGNYHIVEYNHVYDNGANPDGTDDMPGHSGIHLFSRFHADEPDKGGDHNVIRYNVVHDTRDPSPAAADGNGIQMDMWCDDNFVHDNVVFHNDGPGIISFGGSRNTIVHNTLYDNGLLRGARPARTQLMIYSSDEVSAEDNVIADNIACSKDPDTYALFVGDDARTRGNTFSLDLCFNEAGGFLFGRGSEGSLSMDEWNAEPWADDRVGDPAFVDPSSHDLHLLPDSPAIDAATSVPGIVDDIDGDPRPCPGTAGPDIGADEYCPAS